MRDSFSDDNDNDDDNIDGDGFYVYQFGRAQSTYCYIKKSKLDWLTLKQIYPTELVS